MPLKIEEYRKEIEKRRLLREQYDVVKGVPENVQLKILTVLKEVVESIEEKKQKGESTDNRQELLSHDRRDKGRKKT